MCMINNFIKAFTAVFVCVLILVGCDRNEHSISYGDVIFDTVNYTDMQEEELYTNIITAYNSAYTALTDLGASQSALSVYNEAYFVDNDLLAISFQANPDFTYTIEKLTLEKNTLTVYSNVKIPQAHHLLEVNKLILIDLPKNSVPKDVSIHVDFHEVIEK